VSNQHTHTTTIVSVLPELNLQASCSCGWRETPRDQALQATVDVMLHLSFTRLTLHHHTAMRRLHMLAREFHATNHSRESVIILCALAHIMAGDPYLQEEFDRARDMSARLSTRVTDDLTKDIPNREPN
jgi:hypothetical protein